MSLMARQTSQVMAIFGLNVRGRFQEGVFEAYFCKTYFHNVN